MRSLKVSSCENFSAPLLAMRYFIQVSRMLEEHDWIHSERQFFGQPNTSYDFKTNNPREAGQRLKKLEETTSKLERNVNKRAMNMLNEAEERVRREERWTADGFECLPLSNTAVLSHAVQWPDEEEEDRRERQSKNPADHQGAGPEEEWGSEPGMAEGLFSFISHVAFASITRYTEGHYTHSPVIINVFFMISFFVGIYLSLLFKRVYQNEWWESR